MFGVSLGFRSCYHHTNTIHLFATKLQSTSKCEPETYASQPGYSSAMVISRLWTTELNKCILLDHYIPPAKPITPSSTTKSTIKIRNLGSNNENFNTNESSAGKIKRQVLTLQERTKLDTKSDREFYSYPRFVTHVDDNFISTLTDLYRERLRPEWEILDLMSSWVSHLPKEIKYKKVVGHGLNAQELAKNPRLDYFFVKDLNQDQQLQIQSSSFDAVLCTVSVQYLQQPEKVFAEVFRVLKPGGVFIVSFSNRLFYEKAINVWREGNSYSRVQLVVQYFGCLEGFTQPHVIRPGQGGDQRNNSWIMNLLKLFNTSDPFYAVLAYKNFMPIFE